MEKGRTQTGFIVDVGKGIFLISYVHHCATSLGLKGITHAGQLHLIRGLPPVLDIELDPSITTCRPQRLDHSVRRRC
jgi:hypothetical protein